MSLLRDVVFKKWPSPLKLLKLEKNKVDLMPLKKLTVYFDPFNDDASHIRKFNNILHESDIIKTNPKCIIKTEILTDRSESHIIFELLDGKRFIFKCANLKCLEIFQLVNKYITPLSVKEDMVKEPIIKVQKKK